MPTLTTKPKKPSVYQEMLKDLQGLKRKIDRGEPIVVHQVHKEGGRMVIRRKRMPASEFFSKKHTAENIAPMSREDVKGLRDELALSQAAFARWLSASPGTVRQWEQTSGVKAGPAPPVAAFIEKRYERLAGADSSGVGGGVMTQSNSTKTAVVSNLIAAVILLIIVSCIWWLIIQSGEQNGRGITAENAAKILKGMTHRQVVEILGCKPGWYRGQQHKWSQFYYSVSHRRSPELSLNSPNGITIAVEFDFDDLVTSVTIARSQPTNEPEPREHPTIPSR